MRARQLIAIPLAWTWGQRIYALLVLSAVCVFGYAGINYWRAGRYDRFQREINSAGGTVARSLVMLSDSEEAYFLALEGDFSAVNIRSISGYGPQCSIDHRILRKIQKFPEVNSLRLNRVPLHREDYEAIYALENLVQLNLAMNDLSDADLAGIDQLQSLESLDLQYTQITDRSLDRLAALPGLTNLNLMGTDFTPAAVSRLRLKLPNATILYRPSLSPAFRQAVIRLHPTGAYGADPRGGMRLVLRPDPWRGREQDIPALAQLTDVESVTIQKFDVTPTLLEALAALPRLNRINFMDSSLRGKDLSLLGKSKSLRSLRVAGSKLDEAPLASVAKIRSLDSLNIFNCRLTSGGQHVLVSLANVQSLSLRQTVLEDEPLARLLAGLERAENLRLLELAMPSLEDRDVPRLARLRQLLALGVNLNNLGDASIPEFATMNHLDQLDVSGTLITSDGLTQLEAALPDCRIIHHDRRANIPQLSLAEVLSLRQEKDRIAALIRDIGGEVELDSLQPASEGR